MQLANVTLSTYLLVYQQPNAARDPQGSRLAFWRLDRIEDDLRVLEHQAAPYHLVRQQSRPDQPNPTALQTFKTTSGVALVTPGLTIDEAACIAFARPDTTQFALPQRAGFAIFRRGPLAAVSLDSGL